MLSMSPVDDWARGTRDVLSASFDTQVRHISWDRKQMMDGPMSRLIYYAREQCRMRYRSSIVSCAPALPCKVAIVLVTYACLQCVCEQWRRQDLLRGGAKLEIRWKEHSRQTSGPTAAADRWLIVLWLMQYWSKELWVVDICTSWSRTLHNTWIVGCQKIYSKVN